MSEELREALAARAAEENSGGEEEGAPGWMVTFADMMSLLVCFFVLLLSFANQDIEKFRDMLGSVKEAFGVQSERPADQNVAWAPSQIESLGQGEAEQFQNLVDTLRHGLRVDPQMEHYAKVLPEQNGVLVRVDSGFMFEPGSARLTPQSYKILDEVVDTLTRYNYNLVVRGHSDDSTDRQGPYPSNWELSAARAAAALRYILEHGRISPTRLKAVGYADSQPLVPNTSPENKAHNRRVEFYYHSPQGNLIW